jgi:hypothetical protein
VGGGWRKLHNEELHNLYSSPSIIRMIKSRRMRWAGHVALMGEKRNAYTILVGMPEGKRPLGRPNNNTTTADLKYGHQPCRSVRFKITYSQMINCYPLIKIWSLVPLYRET